MSIARHHIEWQKLVEVSGQALPPGLDVRVPQHNEILRPTSVLKSPEEAQPRLLFSA